MFNYSPHKDARIADQGSFFLTHHQLDEAAGVMRILADRLVKVGEQLVEDYGDNKDKIYLQYVRYICFFLTSVSTSPSNL